MRLFVVGNGFDIDHELPSRLHDFKEFLEQSYTSTFNRVCPCFPNVGVGHKGEIVVDPNASGSILYCLISQIDDDYEWNEFENNLGRLEYQTELDLVEDDEDNPFLSYENLVDLVNNLEICLCYSISGIFKEWIDSIDINNVQPKYIFYDDDLFLTFNYTRLLEDLYEIKEENICHIHIENDGSYVVGHDEYRDFDNYDEVVRYKLEEIHEKLRKDTNSCYNEKKSFFDKIYNSNIDGIVFFGFSFNTMDCFYIKELSKHIDLTRIVIYLSEYEFYNEFDEKVNLLKACGFNSNNIKVFD